MAGKFVLKKNRRSGQFHFNLLARNGVPHAFHACESQEGIDFLRSCGQEGSAVPVVILPDGSALVDPRPES